MRNNLARVALRTSLLYWVIAAAWILLSDQALNALSSDPATIQTLQTYKGWAFVSISASLLYVTIRSQLLRWEQEAAQRKQFEEALRESEDRYSDLVENSQDLICTHDLEGQILSVNQAASRLLGYDRDHLLKKNIRDVLGKQFKAEFDDYNARIQKSGIARGLMSVQTKGGETRIWEYVNTLRTEGVAAPVVRSMARDVTEQKRAEAALRRAEEKYRSIFENAVEGIFQLTVDGKLLAANPAMARILGYETAEELIGARADIRTQHYVDRDCWDGLQRVMAEQGMVKGFECEVYRKDQSKLWIVENIRAITDEKGRIVCYEGSIEDTTERKLLEEQLRQAQKMEAIGQLAGGIAHDFNNLLTAITGYSEITIMKLQPHDPMMRNLEEIKKAGERAASLTRQLLAFSRKQVLQPQIINLNTIVSETEKMLRRLIGEDKELLTALNPELGSIRADPGQIQQVIMNLVVNARDAMPQGGRLTIETENVYLDDEYTKYHFEATAGSYVMLAVTDTGTGMEEQTQKRIFDPFFTTKELGKGTGLGLSTVYGIVKQSGGNIWVYSEVGHGTSFKIYLPRISETAHEVKPVDGIRKSLQGTETILLAEDEEIVRDLARTVLEINGYRVLEASNGGAALLICEKHNQPINLLITDVVMPKMSGNELANRLLQSHPEMKVLYISGYTDNAMVHQEIIDREANFMQKPFSPDALAKKVRAVLDNQ